MAATRISDFPATTDLSGAAEMVAAHGGDNEKWSISQIAGVTRRTISGADTLNAGDRARIVDATGTFTIAIAAAATLGNGWWCYVKNSGTGNITIDPNGTETIDGSATIVVEPGAWRLIMCNGSAFFSIVMKGDTLITVAPTDATSAMKAAADYTCDGVDDHVQIQAALDALPETGGRVLLLHGTFTIGATISLGHPTSSDTSSRKILDMDRAQVKWGSVTGKIALIKIENSDCIVFNGRLQGSGAKGNGTGIAFGGLVSEYGGRRDCTVYRSACFNIQAQNLKIGITCATRYPAHTSSSGDCNIIGAYITQCETGWLNDGFVNRWFGGTIASCDYCMVQGEVRREGRMDVFGATMNNWGKVALWLKYGSGSALNGLWFEHTDVQPTGPAECCIRIGTDYAVPNSSRGYVWDARFNDELNILMNDETVAAIQFVSAIGTRIAAVKINTNGDATRTMLRNDMPAECVDNIIDRVAIGPSAYPSSYSYLTGTGAGELFVNRTPAAVSSAAFATDWQSLRIKHASGAFGDGNFVFAPPIGTLGLRNDIGQLMVKSTSGWTRVAKSATITVAASDSPAGQKAMADYICDGTADDVEIQAAIDSLPATGGCVQLLQGTYNISASIAYVNRLWLRGMGLGTILKQVATGGAMTSMLSGGSGSARTQVMLSDFDVDGNKVAVLAATPTAATVGVRTGANLSGMLVLRVNIHDMTSRGSSNSGDDIIFNMCEIYNNVTGGVGAENGTSQGWLLACRIHDNGEDGFYSDSAAFRITNCYVGNNGDTGLNLSGPTASSGNHVVEGCLIELSKNSGINTGGGNNDVIVNNIVRSNGRGVPASSAAGIRVRDSAGGLTGTSDGIIIKGNRCYDDTTMFPLGGATGQQYGIEIANHDGGGAPTNVLIEGNDLRGNLGSGEDSVLFFRNGFASSGSSTIYWRNNIGFSQLGWISAVGCDFMVGREGSTYFAVRQNGTLAGFYKDSLTNSNFPATLVVGATPTDTHTSGLKTLLSAIQAKGKHIKFAAGDFDLGYNRGASWNDLEGCTITGSGMYSTYLMNYITGTNDLEPLSFARAWRVTIRDLTVCAGGDISKRGIGSGGSCDAIDFDQGVDCLVERVRVLVARERAIVFDGKDSTLADISLSHGNVVRDCVIDGTFAPYATLKTAITLPVATINVLPGGVDDFPTAGKLNVGGQIVTYTGKGTNSFTGVTGGTGTFEANMRISFAADAPTAATSAAGSSNVAGNITNAKYRVSYIGPRYQESAASAQSAAVTPTGTERVTLGIPVGPAGTRGRKIWRSSDEQTTEYLIGTIFNNTTTSWEDNLANATLTTAATTINSSDTQLPDANIGNTGITMLASQRNTIEANSIRNVSGVGIFCQGAGTPRVWASRNVIDSNVVRGARDNGIQVTGGDENLITKNRVSNTKQGTNGARGISVTAGSSDTSADNLVAFNVCWDDQQTKTQSYGIRIAGASGVFPTGTRVIENRCSRNLTGGIQDSAGGVYFEGNTGTITASGDASKILKHVGNVTVSGNNNILEKISGTITDTGAGNSNRDDANVTFIIDGGGSALTTGIKGDVSIPFAGTIVGWEILGDQSGSITLDLWKQIPASFPPLVAQTITAAAKPTLTAAQRAASTTLTDWTTAVAPGDIIRFNIDSVATLTRVSVVLRIRKS